MENEDDCLGLRLFKAGLRQSISRDEDDEEEDEEDDRLDSRFSKVDWRE